MPTPLYHSEYIFGMHDPGGEGIMLAAGRPGWVLVTEGIGSDPTNTSGGDYTALSGRGLGVIVRLNNGYYPEGTIPVSSQYNNFAQRCANFVANSRGCKIWIIGNEPNFAIERPVTFRGFSAQAAPEPQLGADQDPFYHGAPARFSALRGTPAGAAGLSALGIQALAQDEAITPTLYTRCYRLCRDAIHNVPGHVDDLVLVAAVAPWNNQTAYDGNPNGDWVQYFRDILLQLGPTGCDGFALHTYTHGVDPNLIEDEARMNAPYNNRRYHFRAYQDFMQAVPTNMRQLPAYITETDQDEPWLNANNGWVQRAYAEIDRWNQQTGNQQIRALILYRWPEFDRWALVNKPGVHEDWRAAMRNAYRWQQLAPGAASFRLGAEVEVLQVANFRRTPGYAGKTNSDILLRLSAGTRLTILNGTPRSVDGLFWWNARFVAAATQQTDGWIAQTIPDGTPLIAAVPSVEPPPPPAGKFQLGDLVAISEAARLRRSPGYLNKPTNDILLDLNQGVQATVIGGPIAQDNLSWWQVEVRLETTQLITGWVAETAPSGVVLLVKVAPSVPTPTPTPSPTPSPTPTPTRPDVWTAGDLVVVVGGMRVRRTPGYLNKAANDVLGDFAVRTTLNLLEGPRTVDGLVWWRVGGIMSTGLEITGWAAQAVDSNTPLMARATKLPGTNIPDKPTITYLGAPFQGNFGIAQLWGENPQIYNKFTYDGVTLKGHNGIDFLTPLGTPLLAVDNGVVAEAITNDPGGFGNYLKLTHSWGESIYAHLQSFSVQSGQRVNRGAVIGQSGNSGFTYGPHLHFAIRINPYVRADGWGGWSDPLPYLVPDKVRLPAYVLGTATLGILADERASFRDRLQRAPGLAPEPRAVRRP